MFLLDLVLFLICCPKCQGMKIWVGTMEVVREEIV